MLKTVNSSASFDDESLKGLQFQFSDSIALIENEWIKNSPADEYWLPPYHIALENALPKGLKPYYCIVSNDLGNVLGLVYIQHKNVNLNEAISLKKEGFWSRIMKKLILPYLRQDTLVIGNFLLTGKYGFHFNTLIDINQQFLLINTVAEELCKILSQNQTTIGPILVKDFFEDQLYKDGRFQTFTQFAIQPNMIFQLNGEWKNFEDYINAFKAKARVRYKRSRKKASGIVKKDLNERDLFALKKIMNELYLNIVKNVNFNLFYLNEDYFWMLKKELGEKMTFTGYFNLEGSLVGFCTALINHGHLDAHFLGYDIEENKNHQIYLNMLFDLVEIGINHGVKSVNLSRTAIEIKSSVGAMPYKMFCYLKHRNRFLNLIVPSVVKYLYRDEAWLMRNPFRDED